MSGRPAPVRCSCGALMVFAVTPQGKRMPLDELPDPAGNVAVYRDEHGVLRGRILRQGEQPAPHEKRAMPHFATCTAAGKTAGHAAEGCAICGQSHPACRFEAGSLGCVVPDCANPHHRSQG